MPGVAAGLVGAARPGAGADPDKAAVSEGAAVPDDAAVPGAAAVVEESEPDGAAVPGGVERPEVSRTGGCPLKYNAASVTKPTVKSPGIAVVSRCNGNRGPLSLPPEISLPRPAGFPPSINVTVWVES